MAAIDVSISGMLYDKLNRTTQSVLLIGEASLTGLGIGGGPLPGGPGGGGGGGAPPHPAFPIWGPPGINFPDKPGYPPVVGGGPILPPDLPPTLPDPDNRPIDWKTAWTPTTGWIVIGIPTGDHVTPSK